MPVQSQNPAGLATLVLSKAVSHGKGSGKGKMKANRELPVRYVHAPCVKLTLSVRRTSLSQWPLGRVLRIATDALGTPYRAR
jgi:hypothetical protein